MTATILPDMKIETVQGKVAAWHRRTFPDATNAAVGLKLAEEAGELAKAVNRMEHTAHGDPLNLREEIGDVAICLMVLSNRYGFDLAEAIRDRARTVLNRPPGDV